MLEDGGDDFETSDDLYDAIGVMLQQADESKTEEEVKEICDRLHSLLHKLVLCYFCCCCFSHDKKFKLSEACFKKQNFMRM